MGAHWVTINGNHVLLDDEGRSLTDSGRGSGEKKKTFPGLKFLNARQTASSLQEMREASRQEMQWNELKAKKLGVTQEALRAIGAVEPKFQAMSADDIRQELLNWWREIGESEQKTLPPMDVLMEQYQITQRGEKGGFYDLKNDLLSAHKALQHYMESSGKSLRMAFQDVDTSRIQVSHFPKIRELISGVPRDAVIDVVDKENFLLPGGEMAFLGDCKLKLEGKLNLTKNGSWSFDGSLKAFDQPYDFNRSSHRGVIGEFSTTVGREAIFGRPYDIEIRGKKLISEQGKMGMRDSFKHQRWLY
ncbi:MAG: lipid II-degrading bacteriocin [bacterium]